MMSPNSRDRRREPSVWIDVGPPNFTWSTRPLPTMSMLCAATIDVERNRRVVGEPLASRAGPTPRPSCETKMIERAGFSVANFSAISSSTTVPEPSSSAPFMIESRRGGRMLRARAMSESISCCCAAVGRHDRIVRALRRVTMFTARSESWSTAVGVDADVIVVRADEHILARRAPDRSPAGSRSRCAPASCDMCHS